MKKYKILVVTLKGCSSCQKLKESMSSAGISYREVTCDQDTELCDQLENITGQSRYPMTIIKDLTKNLDYVYFTSFDYNELGKERKIDEKVRIVPFITPETIIQKINSL